jgi:hypothetical protein
MAPLAALAAGIVLFGLLGASVARASLPEMNVTFSSNGSFTFTYNGAPVAGSTVPSGTYDVVFDNSVDASVAFQITGPGVNFSTGVGNGEPAIETDEVTFSATASYSAQNANVPGSSISFNTSSATASSSSGSSSGSSGSSSSGSSGGGLYGNGTTTTTASTPLEGTLTGAVSATGTLTLAYKGKQVTELNAGRYTLNVTDKSKKVGFVLKQTGKSAITVTTASFTGKKSEQLTMGSGQWYFAASTSAKKKNYFVVIG